MKRFTNIVENIPADREITEFVSPHPQIRTVFVGAAKERFDRENADGKLAERIKTYLITTYPKPSVRRFSGMGGVLSAT